MALFRRRRKRDREDHAGAHERDAIRERQLRVLAKLRSLEAQVNPDGPSIVRLPPEAPDGGVDPTR